MTNELLQRADDLECITCSHKQEHPNSVVPNMHGVCFPCLQFTFLWTQVKIYERNHEKQTEQEDSQILFSVQGTSSPPLIYNMDGPSNLLDGPTSSFS